MSRETGFQFQVVISKTQLIVFDASLLNTQHKKVRIKGKWSKLGKLVAPFPTPPCCSYWQWSLLVSLNYGRPSYIYIYIGVRFSVFSWSVSNLFLNSHTYLSLISLLFKRAHVNAHLKAAAKCIPTKLKTKYRGPWETLAVRGNVHSWKQPPKTIEKPNKHKCPKTKNSTISISRHILRNRLNTYKIR